MRSFRVPYRPYGRIFAGWSLILLYLLGMLAGPVSHQWEHGHDHQALHSPEQEEDPCHRAVYHQDAEHGCEHDTHLNGKQEDCQLCHHFLSSNYLILSAELPETEAPATEQNQLYLSPFQQQTAGSSQNRGPPRQA